MKINVNYKEEKTPVRVWHCTYDSGFCVRNGKIDLEYSKERYNYYWNLRQAAKAGA